MENLAEEQIKKIDNEIEGLRSARDKTISIMRNNND